MKEIIRKIFLVTALYLFVAVVFPISTSAVSKNLSWSFRINKKTLYAETMRVTKVNYKKDLVYISTSTGHIYSFKGTEDWRKGDFCSCIMDSRGTPKVKDDVILSVKYCGF